MQCKLVEKVEKNLYQKIILMYITVHYKSQNACNFRFHEYKAHEYPHDEIHSYSQKK